MTEIRVKNGKPIKKDCYDYFRAKENWLTTFENEENHIRIERLAHTNVFRVVMVGIEPNKWIGKLDMVITYCASTTDKYPNGFFTSQPSVELATNWVYDQWKEEE